MVKMQIFQSWDEVVRCVVESRDKGRMISNFFPDEKRMARWCPEGAFMYEEQGETTFLVRNQKTFSSVYFFSTKPDSLARDVSAFVSRNELLHCVVDVLGRDAVREPLEGAFRSAGFNVLTTLQRMSRRTPTEKYVRERGIDVANESNAITIHRLLTENFIAEEEQIPCLEEVQDWISREEILIARGESENEIKGFTIFDLAPATLYLRYWLVSPDERGKGLGGKLLRSMFAAGMNTKRQYFWVKTDNENAIKRYQHYGFEFEPLKDTVLSRGKL